MTERVECVVIGAGVVGLAVGRALAQAGREVLVLDAADAIGTGTSSRNSEVIHAGIYYPAGSLKAQLCVEGKRRLYEYCAARGVGHSRIGKLIVASDDAEVPVLDGIKAKAEANGVTDMQLLSGAAAQALEPALRVAGALLSPSTGIVDSHGFMLALQGDLENAGGAVVLHAPVRGGEARDGGFVLDVGGAEPMILACDKLVNAAGLSAPALARRIDGIDPATIPDDYLCKGSYYSLTGRAPFGRLIYPVPEKAGLGVHLTLDLGGQARFGPDTEWVATEDYDVHIERAAGFYAAIRRYWPALADGALAPGYAGIRPKINAPDAPSADFSLSGPAQHGHGGLLNLFGIESPGLTASLAIGARVVDMLAQRNSLHN